jgi:hypothetical protein
MHESQVNRKRKLSLVLQLGADDMEQAEAAARALQREAHDVHLRGALETAMAVCYMRPFTRTRPHDPTERIRPVGVTGRRPP